MGGDARIAVRGEFQRQGLGRFIILYGFHKLKEQGIMLAETMITVKRKLSIVLHFQCGFKLQKDASEWKYKDYSFFINRIIANHRVEKMLDEYENKKVL